MQKAAYLNEKPPEVWKTRKFDDSLLWFRKIFYKPNTTKKKTNDCTFSFPKNVNLGINKNYRGITITSIAAIFCNSMIYNRIKSEVEAILRKNQNGFTRNRSTSSQILTIRRILEGVWANLEATPFLIDFSKVFCSIQGWKMGQIRLTYSLLL